MNDGPTTTTNELVLNENDVSEPNRKRRTLFLHWRENECYSWNCYESPIGYATA